MRWGATREGYPGAGKIDRSYVVGVSQSGRILRHLLYLGLYEDEAGPPAWDAVVPHVAGGRRGEVNCRLGPPSLNAVHAAGSPFPVPARGHDDPVTGPRRAPVHPLPGPAPAPRTFPI